MEIKGMLIKVAFWNSATKILGTLASIEAVVFASGRAEVPAWLAVTCGICTWLGLIIAHLAEDKNKNGIIDIAEKIGSNGSV